MALGHNSPAILASFLLLFQVPQVGTFLANLRRSRMTAWAWLFGLAMLEVLLLLFCLCTALYFVVRSKHPGV